MAWLAITIFLLFVGYAWLSLYAGSNQSNNAPATVKKLQPGDSGTISQLAQTDIEKIPEMPITSQSDQERVQQYLEIEAKEQKILPLLDSADVFFENNQLVSPAGENAWENYQAILAIDPNENVAISGLTKIKSKLIDNAEQAIEERDTETAESWIKQLDIIQDGDSLQAELRDEVAIFVRAEEQRKEAEAKEKARQESIAKALDTAKESILKEPIDYDKSTKLFNSVLQLDTENSQAKDGLTHLSDLKLDQAEQTLRDKDINQATIYYNQARDISPENKRLGSLEIAINASLQQQTLEKQQEQQRLEAELFAQQKQLQEQQALEEIAKAKAEEQAKIENQLNIEKSATETAVIDSNNATQQITSTPLKSTTQETRLDQGIKAYYAGDYLNSFELLSPLESEYPRAQFRLGVMYRFGRGVPADSAEATRLFTAALPQLRDDAEQGAPWAQTDLGTAYEFGMAVEQDFEQAAYWYQQAADQNYSGAQTNLGVLYAQGEGVTKSRNTAIEWFRKAAAQGDRAAIENLNTLGVSP